MSTPAVALAFVALAGTAAVLRVALASRLNRPGALPWGTLAVNVVGAFALGLLAGAGPEATTAIGVGGLGALTTWSTFAVETDTLARHAPALAGAYVALSVMAGVGAAWAGLALSGT